MPDLIQSLQSGSMSLWVFIPTALLLGALHALEPGHSKTMMTAFIIAIRGTIWQAVLLGLSAALSHSVIIWLLAAVALKAGENWDAAVWEPYLQAFSGICILALSVWMLIRTRRDLRAAQEHHHHSHGHHDHGHHHGYDHSHPVHAATAAEFQDAHERQHALEIEQKFAGRAVTTPQIILFGITGGLMPCPAALSVLLICVQLKRIALGFTLVAAFSTGLALVMVATGVIAAWSLRQAQSRFRGLGNALRKAPFISSALLATMAAYMLYHGIQGIRAL
jgi:nickel/cobalt exporter